MPQNLDGLGELAPLGSGVLMTLICGGALLALQGRIADHVGNDYTATNCANSIPR